MPPQTIYDYPSPFKVLRRIAPADATLITISLTTGTDAERMIAAGDIADKWLRGEKKYEYFNKAFPEDKQWLIQNGYVQSSTVNNFTNSGINLGSLGGAGGHSVQGNTFNFGATSSPHEPYTPLRGFVASPGGSYGCREATEYCKSTTLEHQIQELTKKLAEASSKNSALANQVQEYQKAFAMEIQKNKEDVSTEMEQLRSENIALANQIQEYKEAVSLTAAKDAEEYLGSLESSLVAECLTWIKEYTSILRADAQYGSLVLRVDTMLASDAKHLAGGEVLDLYREVKAASEAAFNALDSPRKGTGSSQDKWKDIKLKELEALDEELVQKARRLALKEQRLALESDQAKERNVAELTRGHECQRFAEEVEALLGTYDEGQGMYQATRVLRQIKTAHSTLKKH